jgi:hypothetical protein
MYGGFVHKFKHRVVALPPEEGCSAGIAGFSVSGAGTTAVDGLYCFDGTDNGYNFFTRDTNNDGGNVYYIAVADFPGYGPNWAILGILGDEGSAYYRNENINGGTPPSTGWIVEVEGSAPVPSVTAV